MKNIMKEAHKMTKEIKKEFPNVDYKAQLGICISFLYEENKKGNDNMEMAKLEGSEKQIKWAESLRKEFEKTFKTFSAKIKLMSDKELKYEIPNITDGLNLVLKDNYKNLINLEKDLEIEDINKIINNMAQYKDSFLANEKSAKVYIDTRSCSIWVKLVKAYIEY